MRLRTQKNIRRNFASGLDLGDMARGAGVHVRAGGEVDFAFSVPKRLLNAALDLSQSFAAAERLGAGDEN